MPLCPHTVSPPTLPEPPGEPLACLPGATQDVQIARDGPVLGCQPKAKGLIHPETPAQCQVLSTKPGAMGRGSQSSSGAAVCGAQTSQPVAVRVCVCDPSTCAHTGTLRLVHGLPGHAPERAVLGPCVLLRGCILKPGWQIPPPPGEGLCASSAPKQGL